MRSARPLVALLFSFAITASIAGNLAACDDSNSVKESLPDASTADTSSGGIDSGDLDGGGDGPKDCFDNPKTHFEIINACTTATKIPKNPTLSKLLPDGGLPPLL